MSDIIAGNNRITVDILDRNQAKVGPGPIMTCLGLDCDSLLSQAGHFTARFPANDTRLAYLQLKKHYLDFYDDGQLIFYGLAEQSREEIDNSGERLLVISGRDSLAVLSEISVNRLNVDSAAAPVFDAPYQILLYDGLGMGIAGDLTTATGVYGDFVGESKLSALTRIAENIGECFRLYGRDSIYWLNDFEPSNLRAIQGTGDSIAVEGNPNVCLIQRLSERRDTSRMITRIFPYGSGIGETRLDLNGTGRHSPTGFILNEELNYIESVAGAAYMGKTISRTVNFKDIRPLFNTDADIISAKNFLFDAALAYLKRNDSVDDVVEYDLDVVKLPVAADPGAGLFGLRPGMAIRVVYADDRYSLDTDLIVLGIRTAIGEDGAATYSLTVSNINQWRLKETSNSIADIEEGQILSGHAQIDANSYWKHYKEWIGEDQLDHMAEIPFFLSREVVTIRQVLFRYKVERILAAFNTYALADATLPNSASSTGASNTAATADTNVAATAGTTVTATAGTTVPNTGDSPPDTGGVTGGTSTGAESNPNTGNSPPSTGPVDGTSNTDLASQANTGFSAPGATDNDTGAATGLISSGNTDSALGPGAHIHTVTGMHAHGMTPHSHPHATTHRHTITHTHPFSHIHTNTHVHGMPHTHPFTHTHTSLHVHGMPHTHNMPHTHTMPHTHNMPHTHPSPTHIHPLPSLIATFVLQRVPALSSYVIADLEYSINGGAWFGLEAGVPVAGGYYEADITPTIQNPAGLRRPYQEDNIIQVRRKTTAGGGKSAQIRVELGIRTTIQSVVAYS